MKKIYCLLLTLCICIIFTSICYADSYVEPVPVKKVFDARAFINIATIIACSLLLVSCICIVITKLIKKNELSDAIAKINVNILFYTLIIASFYAILRNENYFDAQFILTIILIVISLLFKIKHNNKLISFCIISLGFIINFALLFITYLS